MLKFIICSKLLTLLTFRFSFRRVWDCVQGPFAAPNGTCQQIIILSPAPDSGCENTKRYNISWLPTWMYVSWSNCMILFQLQDTLVVRKLIISCLKVSKWSVSITLMLLVWLECVSMLVQLHTSSCLSWAMAVYYPTWRNIELNWCLQVPWMKRWYVSKAATLAY